MCVIIMIDYSLPYVASIMQVTRYIEKRVCVTEHSTKHLSRRELQLMEYDIAQILRKVASSKI